MLLVNLGEYRGYDYTNSGDERPIRVLADSVPDGTLVTIRRKHPNYNWVTINEDDEYNWYPLDLLTNTSKANYVLAMLKCLQ
jgi:hypothetical protein